MARSRASPTCSRGCGPSRADNRRETRSARCPDLLARPVDRILSWLSAARQRAIHGADAGRRDGECRRHLVAFLDGTRGKAEAGILRRNEVMPPTRPRTTFRRSSKVKHQPTSSASRPWTVLRSASRMTCRNAGSPLAGDSFAVVLWIEARSRDERQVPPQPGPPLVRPLRRGGPERPGARRDRRHGTARWQGDLQDAAGAEECDASMALRSASTRTLPTARNPRRSRIGYDVSTFA